MRITVVAAFLAALGGGADAGTISGALLSEGKPVAKAKIILALRPGGLGAIEVRDSAVSDSLGRYAFKRVPPGHWHLAAGAAGLADGTAEASLGDSGEAVVADVLLRSGAASKAGGVTGVIRAAESGSALKGARVELKRKEWSPAQSPLPARSVDSAVSDGQGRYAFDSLDFRADYLLEVTAKGRAAGADSQVSAALQQTLTRSFDLEKSGKKSRAGKK